MGPERALQLLRFAAAIDPVLGRRDPAALREQAVAWAAVLDTRMTDEAAADLVRRHYAASSEHLTPARLNALFLATIRKPHEPGGRPRLKGDPEPRPALAPAPEEASSTHTAPQHVLIREVPCPWCKAGAWQPCTVGALAVVWVHPSRADLWHARLLDGPSDAQEGG